MFYDNTSSSSDSIITWRIKKRRPSTTNNGQGVSSVENQSVKSESGASVKRNISHHGSSEWHSNDARQSLTTSTQSSNLAQSPVVSAQTSSWTQGVPDNETETDTLRLELAKAKRTILELQEKEQKLKDRLAEQALRMLERGVRFENINLGERRPTALIRRYGSLYAQARVDTLDALENLPELKDADELKSKLLFSVVVLAFRSVQRTVADMKQKIRRVLQIPESADHLSNKDSIKELETSLNTYLRSTANTFDVSKNIEEVCTQIWATLYDYPCLKTCEGLTTYIKDCVRLAWSLSIQNPPFIIEYETLSFRRDMHVRFHTSDQNSETIKTYLWPCLLEESSNGPCITKGVVIT